LAKEHHGCTFATIFLHHNLVDLHIAEIENMIENEILKQEIEEYFW